MKLMSWQRASDGTITGPPIHDGYINSISYSEPEYLELGIINGGIEFYARLEHIHELGLSISRSPVCSCIFVWEVDKSPEVDMGIPDNAWNVLHPYDDYSGVSARRTRVIKRHRSAILVNVSCSYGGDISIVCESIKFYEK